MTEIYHLSNLPPTFEQLSVRFKNIEKQKGKDSQTYRLTHRQILWQYDIVWSGWRNII